MQNLQFLCGSCHKYKTTLEKQNHNSLKAYWSGQKVDPKPLEAVWMKYTTQMRLTRQLLTRLYGGDVVAGWEKGKSAAHRYSGSSLLRRTSSVVWLCVRHFVWVE